MTKESKLIVASNLTTAALLREQMMSSKGGSPVMQTKDVIMQTFEEFVSLLDKKYPEK